MKKFSKGLFVGVLTVILAVSFPFTAYADPDTPPTGDVAIEGDLSIVIINKTDGEYTGNINVSLTCIASERQFSFDLGLSNVLLEIPYERTITANTTYTVAFRFDRAGYVILDKRNLPVNRLHITASGYEAVWVLRDVNAVISGDTGADIGQVEADIPTDLEDVYIEAHRLWNRFLTLAITMANDNDNRLIFNAYHMHHVTMSQNFERFTHRTADDFIAMSLFERFLWDSTYVRIVDMLHMGEFDTFFGSAENYRSRAIGQIAINIGRTCQETAAAYEELMMWQYDYIRANSTVFNFITGVNHRDSMRGETGEPFSFDPIEISEERAADEDRIIQSEIQEFLDELPVPLGADDVEYEANIWDRTIARLSANWFTILLLIVVFGGLVGVIVYRKHNEIKEVGED
ncbi:MAG: hypothetical protein FWE05_04915 [Defluviitaleaceae bacterium]|nr:hypothetical protein [Defluviitaleaceae bacterium]